MRGFSLVLNSTFYFTSREIISYLSLTMRVRMVKSRNNKKVAHMFFIKMMSSVKYYDEHKYKWYKHALEKVVTVYGRYGNCCYRRYAWNYFNKKYVKGKLRIPWECNCLTWSYIYLTDVFLYIFVLKLEMLSGIKMMIYCTWKYALCSILYK